MDKKSVIGIVLISIIILLWPAYNELVGIKPAEKQDTTAVTESVPDNQGMVNETSQQVEPEKEVVTPVVEEETLPAIQQIEDEYFTEIETPLVSAKISNKGGGNIYSWQLKKYKNWDESNVHIADESFANGPDMFFTTLDGERFDLSDFNFTTDRKENLKIDLKQGESYTLHFNYTVNNTRIEKTLTIYADSYHVDINVNVLNSRELLLNNEYYIGWKNGLPSNEVNAVEDYTYSDAYAFMGDELEDYSISEEGAGEVKTLTGQTTWIAVRTKYFMSALIPRKATTVGTRFSGEGIKTAKVVEKKYNAFVAVNNEEGEQHFQLFMGPLDYSIVSDYEIDLENIILNHGWYERTFRIFSLAILYVFKFFQVFIPNYGIVIILFSILIKIVVYPLTRKSYQSMKEMSRVQPLMNEIKEKYKSDPQRQQKELMKLYKEHNISPLGGCLPTLLQLPLLAALFIVFRSTIQLRGASFIPGWIDDLSRPDTLATLPFSLPMYGDQFNLLPILMAGSMIIQSKMTMKDPKQKAMVYVMPVFLLLIFNQFPSGLNLYYTLFNVLTIVQQKLIDKQHDDSGSGSGAVAVKTKKS
jgi:YidC/Oxa1 family membrane protein insertase